MGYNILRYKHNDSTSWGVQKGDHITPFASEVIQLRSIIEDGHLVTAQKIAENGDKGQIAVSDVEFLSPVTRPTRLLALGVNYHEHRDEAGASHEQNETLFFRKDDCAINSATGDIVWPKGESLLDYEVEMGLIIKKDISERVVVTAENIGDFVAGMVLVNDVSARFLMVSAPFGQWYKGKSARTLCPVGPYIHIFDDGEASAMHDMSIRLWVNDDLRQDAHTGDLITKPELALSEASEYLDLAVGDVLLTGTPGGVAIKAPSKFKMAIAGFIPEKRRYQMLVNSQLKSGKFLKEGDVIRCTLQSENGRIDCGQQLNQVVKPANV